MKTALITGATDGIGRALALALAKCGYTIHVLGRGEEKGREVLESLKSLNAKASHELFLVDLSTIKNNREFLEMYREKYNQLDVLVLNANAMFKEPRLNSDGVDTGFMIGYLSRYMFSVGLNDLLLKTEGGRVLHIGGATLVKPIKFDKLKTPDYKGSDSTYMGFMANNLMVEFVNSKRMTEVPYEFMEPGIVNTNTVKSQNYAVRLISRMMGMIEPDESGERIAEYLDITQADGGVFYTLGKKKSPKKSVKEGQDVFKQLMEFSIDMTGYRF